MKYRESLSFNHPILWVILLPLTAYMAYGTVQQLIFDQPFGSNPAPDFWLVVFMLIPLLLLMLLAFARLSYRIDDKGFHFRFFPFHLKEHQIPWAEVEELYVRKYKALKEFGGWGIRINFSGNKAYNVIGDKGMGLEILRKDKKKVLFSTRNPQQLRQFLDELSSKGKPF